MMSIYDILFVEEGFRNDPYLCSEGFVTIGIGTKLHNDRGQDPSKFPLDISVDTAKALMTEELLRMQKQLDNSEVGHIFIELDDDRADIILSMAYQMGVRGVLQFKDMWSALDHGHYSDAADAALDSRWAKQTPERASRHAAVIRSGDVSTSYKFPNYSGY